MSLLTRCPACTTVYRVVPDQLRISQGWVKCGQCGDIFDATQHLIQTAIAHEEVPADPAPAVSDDLVEVSHDQVTAGESGQHETDASSLGARAEDSAMEQAEPSLQLADSDLTPGSDVGRDMPLQAGDDGSVSSVPEAQEQESLEALPTQVASGKDRDDEGVQVSFMTRAAVSSFWQRRSVQAQLLLLAVLLSCLLCGQWVVQERHRLAAWHPELRPVLQALCDVLTCSMGPLQQIESVALDSAAFYTLGADRYRLSFTLKNSAHLAVALPSIELTLTDALDQAVIRRVLSTAELAAISDRLEPAAEWPVTMVLKVTAAASVPRVVGYRLLAFYP